MNNRTNKSIKNAAVSAVVQACTLLLSFLVRTALIFGLGKYYLGLNSVMVSLIAVFNLAELGLTNAVVFSLYKPLANQDQLKIEALLSLYKKVYRIIGASIIAISIAALPFLPDIINTEITVEVYGIYGLFVLSTASSYLLFTYRSALLQANQEKYLVSYVDLVFTLISSIGQIICFVLFSNYLAGLIVLALSQIVRSLLILIVTKRRYSHINFNSTHRLETSEKRSLAKNVYAMAIGKFSDTATKNVPNLAISAGIGLVESGMYSNYQMISVAITTYLAQVVGSLTASVGNLNVEAVTARKIEVFDRINFATFVLYAICCSCVFTCTQPFIAAWIGEDYLLNTWCVLGLAFNLLTIGLMHGTAIFKDGCGIFFQGRFRPLVGCALTVLLCVALVKPFGIAGAIWAPAIARILTANWYDPMLLYKYIFKTSPCSYYAKTCLYAAVSIACMVACSFACNLLSACSWLLVVESALVSSLLTLAIVLTVFARYKPERYFFGLLLKIARKG